MTVTKDYLKAHFDDLVAVPDGQQIEVIRDEAGVHLTFVTGVTVGSTVPKNTLWGAMRQEYLRGELWMADDFNSPATNQQVEEMFYGEGE